ncbi:hypothetical protein QTP70_032778 [Hemibagrus guttatus]|uniref:Spliceosome-associated protein CWC27 homolog n=1 Tax=Hemibagrus guttatus TaxID=175788 RepID=A0AAE0QJ69_9TELE|nr:hypothetical protein QTP70_032778 [Hemibagrus guttatus]
MSNIYIQEPPTNGKVLIKTSAGDIDVELWSKEAPKACRNFIQLCMEGLPLNAIRPLQMIQNAAAPLVFNLPKFSHTTPLLRSLHWLPVAARIRFKTLMLAYKAKNGPAPSYLKALITPRTAPRSLRSTSTARLVPPSLREKGYYNGTIFHRVVPDFIIQGGDPTGTGTGGESVYGRPFKDEFHSRLRFNRRGLVAMANAGPHDNGSQFFFTLGRADELNNKHTIFGKVTGDTVYNMLRLAEVECDRDERPLKPHKIRSTEVLHSPFDDITPREIRVKKEKHKEEEKKSQSKATKNFSLLSFGEEAEEEEEMVTQVSQTMKGKSKSSHDLLKDDPKLSSVPVLDSSKSASGDVSEGDDETQDQDDDEKMRKKEMRERISNKLMKEKVEEEKSEVREETEKKSSRSEELRKEARQLKRELLAIKQRKDERMKPEEESSSGNGEQLIIISTNTDTSQTPTMNSSAKKNVREQADVVLWKGGDVKV